jgi:hypothetical protein
MFCNGSAELYFICFKAKMCNRIFVKLGRSGEHQRYYRMHMKQKQWAELQCSDSGSILKMETKGWLTMLKVGNQALLSQMWILIKLPTAERGHKIISLNVSLGRVHHITTVEWGMSRVCATSRPCDFSDQQKRKRVEIWKWNVPLDEQNP